MAISGLITVANKHRNQISNGGISSTAMSVVGREAERTLPHTPFRFKARGDWNVMYSRQV